MSNAGIKKLYYSISEVSELTQVEAHVLRFWEKEFASLKPRRGRSGNRNYRERDIELIRSIKELLYEQKYTIPGAADQLKKDRSLQELQNPEKELSVDSESSQSEILDDLRRMLEEVKLLVQGDVKHE